MPNSLLLLILKNKVNILIFALFCVLFGLYTWHINDLYLPFVLDDEFGYWSIAAYFTGYDWSSTTSHIYYYSYGYSLLLTPLFWLFSDPVIMYRAAIVINAALLSFVFVLAYKVGRHLFPNSDKYIILATSFCVSVYTSNIVYSSIAWSESLLTLVFWLVALQILKIDKYSKWWKFASLGFLLMYVYSIHQRSIGVVLAAFIILFIMALKKHINFKQVLLTIIVAVCLFVVHIYIKEDIQRNLWLNSLNLNHNDFEGQVQKIKFIFSMNGLIKTLQVFCGQLFYIGVSSYLVSYLGLIKITQKTFGRCFKVKCNDDYMKSRYFYAFLFLSFALTLAISVIFMNNPERIDHIFYGRYIEMLIGPIILIGIINLYENSNGIKLYLITSIVVLIFTGVIARLFVSKFEGDSFFSMTVVGLRPFYSDHLSIFSAIMASVGIIILLWLAFVFNRSRILSVTCIVLYSSIFVISGMKMIDSDLIPAQNSNSMTKKIVQFINENYGDNYSIYFFVESDLDRSKDFFQFLLLDKQLICVDEDDLEQITGDNKLVITTDSNPLTFPLLNEYTLDYAKGNYYLWKYSGWTNKENKLKLPFSLFGTINGISADATENSVLKSNGTAGFLMYGPYMTLEKGSYTVSVEMELHESTTDELGYIEIVSGQSIINKEILYKSSIGNSESFEVTLPINLQSETDNIEFRVFTQKDTVMSIKTVNFSKDFH